MARYLLRSGHSRDGNGKVVLSATIQVYQAGTTTAPTNMYTAKTGGSAITTGQTTSSSSDGSYAIYIDDSDHPIDTEFDLTVSKSGYTSITYEDIRG